MRIRKLIWPVVAVAAIASGTVYVAYSWLYKEEEEDDESSQQCLHASRSQNSSQPSQNRSEAEAHLQNHFTSIQQISDSTTLPQMLEELEAGLDRVANVDLLISRLRRASTLPAGGQSLGKADLWQELKLVTWARTMSATWLVALTSLLLRVQLNILGRHIFLQTHLLDPKQNEWESQRPARKVTGRAQEMFIEYAHYLPEQASARIVACMRRIVGNEIGHLELSQPLEASRVLDHASSIHAAFEEWALDQGWAQLMLPTQAEAAEYFRRFKAAPPDTGALGRQYLEVDEEVIQGMVGELHGVLSSDRFSFAALAAVQQAAKSLAKQLQASLGQLSLPLAKVLPRMTAAGNALLYVREGRGQEWLTASAELPQVQELCASVYCCGPAL